MISNAGAFDKMRLIVENDHFFKVDYYVNHTIVEIDQVDKPNRSMFDDVLNYYNEINK